MRSLRYIGTVLMLLIAFLQGANAREESETDYKEQQVDVNEIVFGHIGDSYEWHITDIGDTPYSYTTAGNRKKQYRMARFSFF
jgi:ATP synthase subunit a